MDVLLIILGILGLGAVVISTYVFTVAARTYVSDDHHRYHRNHSPQASPARMVVRSPVDRRSGQPATFPLMVNGILITNDRRTAPERRALR